LTVAKWEAGINYPKTEHLKRLIVLGVESQAFPKDSEPAEIRALWKAAHQKAQIDEYWLSALLSQESKDHHIGQGRAAAPTSAEETGITSPVNGQGQGVGAIPRDLPEQGQATAPTSVEDRESGPGQDLTVRSPLDARLVEATGAPPLLPKGQISGGNRSNKTRGRRKWLLPILIPLAVLIIIGSAGTLFFYIREHATDQTYPGYLSGQGTLVFSDSLSQNDKNRWD